MSDNHNIHLIAQPLFVSSDASYTPDISLWKEDEVLHFSGILNTRETIRKVGENQTCLWMCMYQYRKSLPLLFCTLEFLHGSF